MTEKELINEFSNKYEKFIVRDGDWIKNCLLDFFNLTRRNHQKDFDHIIFHQLLMEINRVLLSADIDEHFSNKEMFFYKFDASNVYYQTSNLTYISLEVLRATVDIAYRIYDSLLYAIKGYNLYLSDYPNIDYTTRPRTRICYRISTFDLESITLLKFSPWSY